MPPVIWNSTRCSASKLGLAAKLVAIGAGADFDPSWNGALIKQAGKDLSYLSIHYVVRLNGIVNKAPDDDTKTAIPLALPVGMANLIQPIRQQVDANPATKGRVGLAYTEWNWGGTGPSSTNIGGAVMGAGWMNMMLSQADFVPISSMSGLMGGGGLQVARNSLGHSASAGRSGFTRIAPGTRWSPPKPRCATMTFTMA
jgi:alpha-N-arabinofuranosidase